MAFNNPGPDLKSVKTDFSEPCTKLCAWLALLVLGLTSIGVNGQQFPQLTAQVVDSADLLNEQQEASLIQTLAAHETETSNQVVVATIADLNDYAIADYANRLGRYWEIGTAESDNGVLLVVAPNERQVRIEVGYGLEGALTDALSSIIIQREILPAFRKNDYPTGINKGVNAILMSITGEYQAQPDKRDTRNALPDNVEKFLPLIFIAMVAIPELLRRKGLRKAANGAFPAGFAGLMLTVATGQLYIGLAVAIAVFLWVYFKGKNGNSKGRRRNGGYVDTGGSGRGFGGGIGSGGFSGGGGSFGGGGASGSW